MLIEKDIPVDNPYYYKKLTEKTLCFDIETTGLNRKFSHITVIGTGFIKNNCIKFRQWMLEKPSEEKELLAEFSDYLKDFDSLLQFNGNAFDIPYVSERCSQNSLPDPFSHMQSIDLYKNAKRLKNVLNLDNCKQKSFEKLFNIERKDLISGRDCIYAYNDYLKYKDPNALNALLLHNEEDVTGLLKLNSLCSFDNIENSLIPSSIKLISTNDIQYNISFMLSEPLPFEINTSDSSYELKISDNKGILLLNGISDTKKYFFDNYKDYFYLPLEDTAIHKSVGIYVDTDHRRKATKETCYEKITDIFFFEPSEILTPIFKDSSRSKELWFNKKSLDAANNENLLQLLQSYLSYIFR